ncbi:MAG: hypothetical protein HC927_07140 [Deltaproteobacteria bacterium]|nr:hypothetical protein [Deltaproteobacteria bacterium]
MHLGASGGKNLLYLYQGTRGNSRTAHLSRIAFSSEQASAICAIERAELRMHLEVGELNSYVDLQGALVRLRCDVVLIAGHEAYLGLLDALDDERREHFAVALAELLATNCRPNATIVLLGCNTSYIGPELALRGLSAVACDGEVDGNAFPAFIAGFISNIAAGRSSLDAFIGGCQLMLFEHWAAVRAIRWFGPGPDVEGRGYEWIRTPHFDSRPRNADA